MRFEVNELNQQSLLLAVAGGGRTGISMAMASPPAWSQESDKVAVLRTMYRWIAPCPAKVLSIS